MTPEERWARILTAERVFEALATAAQMTRTSPEELELLQKHYRWAEYDAVGDLLRSAHPEYPRPALQKFCCYVKNRDTASGDAAQVDRKEIEAVLALEAAVIARYECNVVNGSILVSPGSCTESVASQPLVGVPIGSTVFGVTNGQITLTIRP